MFHFDPDIFTALRLYEEAGRTQEAWDQHLKPIKDAIHGAKAFPLKFMPTGDFHGLVSFARPDGSGFFSIGVRVEGTSAWGCLLQLDTANEKREVWFDADEREPQRRRPIRLGGTFF